MELSDDQRSRYKPGQSSRGVSRMLKYFSKVPAQASLFVKKLDFKLKSFFTVAGMEECSNCEVGVGPSGSWITTTTKNKDEECRFQYMITRMQLSFQ